MKNLLYIFFGVMLLVVLTFACGVNDHPSADADQQLAEQIPTKKLDQKVYNLVDEMPLFVGCQDRLCSNEKLIQYIVDRMTYPEEAKNLGLEGKVFVQFVVNPDGRVSDIEVKRTIGGGASEAAVSIVESFNDGAVKWQPGIDEGEAVPVRFTLPFSFKLES